MPSEKRLQYNQFVLTNNKKIKEYNDLIHNLESKFSNNQISNRYTALAIVTFQLHIISLYVQQDDEYSLLFEGHNKSILEDSRKIFGEIFMLLKTYFSLQISNEFSKTEEYISELKHLTPQRLLNLISQLEFLCIQLKQKYGPTSKYIISIASIYGNICGFTLNIIDFPKYINIARNLSHEDYTSVKELLQLFEKMLEIGSTLYIDAYQISIDDKDQVRKALTLLGSLETYSRLIGHKELLEQLERKKHSWERYLSQ